MKAKQTYRVQKREKKCTFAILKIEGIWGGGVKCSSSSRAISQSKQRLLT